MRGKKEKEKQLLTKSPCCPWGAVGIPTSKKLCDSRAEGAPASTPEQRALDQGFESLAPWLLSWDSNIPVGGFEEPEITCQSSLEQLAVPRGAQSTVLP